MEQLKAATAIRVTELDTREQALKVRETHLAHCERPVQLEREAILVRLNALLIEKASELQE